MSDMIDYTSKFVYTNVYTTVYITVSSVDNCVDISQSPNVMGLFFFGVSTLTLNVRH